MASALIVVDVQNDFCPGGALAVPDGDAVIARINELAASDAYDVVVATRDLHPPDHGSFTEQGGTWPVHCVAGTPGAELHPALDQEHVDAVVSKGQARDDPGYSGFAGTELAQLLREELVTAVTVVGLATDYCVRATALDAVAEGLMTSVDRAAVRAVDVEPGDGERALAEVAVAGGVVTEA